jgi:hypothetical protein
MKPHPPTIVPARNGLLVLTVVVTVVVSTPSRADWFDDLSRSVAESSTSATATNSWKQTASTRTPTPRR